ncbi:MAG: DUF4230 domain-containing protein, partial [Saprospiraceae bacterium]|nr:DUF4230 domain-containing protein [Saprospiraceae bacterium]
LQLNYIPADYSPNVDEEEALRILSNPQRNRKEFNDLVFKINMSILMHVANRMGLDDANKSKIRPEYEKHHEYLKNLYYHDFVSLKDTTSNLYQSWYDNESSNAVDILREIASKYTCFLVTQIMTTLVQTKAGSIYARGSDVDTPCGIAMTEALTPLLKRMEERAAIEDFSRSRGLLQEKVEKAIAELATMEVRDKKGINKQMQTKIWGFQVSSSDVEITAISILKVGFRLDEYFNISLNPKTNIVSITLPEPTILSHEVYPKIEKLDIGWMREVKSINLNSGINALREEFRREAQESDIMDQSRTQAIELMNTMFGPLLKSMNRNYQLRVKFRESPRDTEMPDEPGDDQNGVQKVSTLEEE